ncbi:MAG TPA: AraC family transcriptional regulator [Mucilaginibacter sp.]|nr:AraC family transcriptional regulator [Mucilaginibacter sp.]
MKNKGPRKREGFEGQRLIVLPKKVISDFLTRDLVTRQIYITDIGYYPKAEFHYAERPAGISQHIIIYCIEGSGWLEISKKRIDVNPSEFIIIPANIPHRYGASNNKPWTIYWVHFKGELAAYITELILNNSENYKPNLSYNDQRIKLFEDIYHNLEKGYSGDALRYVNMIFSHFLSSLIYEEKFGDSDQNNEKNVVALSVDLMQKKIHAVIKLSEFASFANLSVSHFSAIFKGKTGYSPIEYFNHLKIQKACQYLSFTDMPVKELAMNLGIEDQYYFSRMFTKLMGVSPTEYRKRNKNNL